MWLAPLETIDVAAALVSGRQSFMRTEKSG